MHKFAPGMETKDDCAVAGSRWLPHVKLDWLYLSALSFRAKYMALTLLFFMVSSFKLLARPFRPFIVTELIAGWHLKTSKNYRWWTGLEMTAEEAA